MCSTDISALPLPAARAARMNSRGQIAREPARATRANTGMLKMPMAMIALTGAEYRGDHDCRQQRGEGEDDVVEAHQRVVDIAAARGGPAPKRDADAHADAHGHKRHRDGVAGADHDHRQHVATELVGAEPMRRGRRLHAVGDDQLGDVVGRPEEGQKRRRRDQRRYDKADDERPVGEGFRKEAGGGCCLVGHARVRRRGSTIA